VIVLFGATGDLARRKLIPGLFHLERVGLMPEDYRIVGSTLEELDDEEFRARARGSLEEFCRMDVGGADWEAFSERLGFAPARADALAARVGQAEQDIGRAVRRLHYLSVPPAAAGSVVRTLGAAGLVARARVVMEKPFGTDLESARRLNATVRDVFREEQIFRIDHFLGKEAALNMLTLRFANGFLEPLESRAHRSRPDRRPGDALDRHARRLLRGDRRLSRHGRDPSVAGTRRRRDGAAAVA